MQDEAPRGLEPITFRSQAPCLAHWAPRAKGAGGLSIVMLTRAVPVNQAGGELAPPIRNRSLNIMISPKSEHWAPFFGPTSGSSNFGRPWRVPMIDIL